MWKKFASRATLLAVPVVALVVLGIEVGSTSFAALPPVKEAPAVSKPANRAVTAGKDSQVLDLTTWEETALKSGVRR